MGPPREREEGPKLPRPPRKDQVPRLPLKASSVAERPRQGRSRRAIDRGGILSRGPGGKGSLYFLDSTRYAGSLLAGEGRRPLDRAARARPIASRTPRAAAVPTKRTVVQ